MTPHDTPDAMFAMLLAWILGTIALLSTAIILWH
jgi:hypothetical protein